MTRALRMARDFAAIALFTGACCFAPCLFIAQSLERWP